MSERKRGFDYYSYPLKPGEVRCLIQYPRRANVKTIGRRLTGLGIIVDQSYEAVVLDPKRPIVVVRGIGSLEAIRTLQESGTGIKIFGEGRIYPA